MSEQHPDPANWTRDGTERHPWNDDLRTYAVHCMICGEYVQDSPHFPGVDYACDECIEASRP